MSTGEPSKNAHLAMHGPSRQSEGAYAVIEQGKGFADAQMVRAPPPPPRRDRAKAL
jgi:hypothetical protein